MNRCLSLLLAVMASPIGLLCTGGCSVNSALSQPPYFDTKAEVTLGASRVRMAELLGPPKLSTQEPPDGHHLDYYEFKIGTPGASRLRVVGYVAGDVVTAGLAEVIFWPVELALLKARDFKAHVSYDLQEHVKGYRIVGDDGSVWQQDGTGVDGSTGQSPSGSR